MEEEDDFSALYGDDDGQKETNVKTTTQRSGAQIKEDEDDEALFMQLYGGKPQEEEEGNGSKHMGRHEPEPDVVLNPPKLPALLVQSVKAEEEGKQEGAPGGQPHAGGQQDEMQEDEEEDSDSEDDLMITLDENAAAYEPPQSRFQKTFHATTPSAGLGQDVGGVEGGIPGLGGAAPRVAIGGIPRSAIPGLAVSFAAAAQLQAAPRQQQAQKLEREQQQQAMAFNPDDAVFPSEWKPGLPIKLPGQTKVSPEEYKEFLSLGHGDIFGLDLDSVIDPPWLIPGTDPGDFFNYGMSMNDWKIYQERVRQFRMEFTMKGQIQTLDQSAADAPTTTHWQAPALPEEIEGDRSLQTSMLDARDESYEAFVTSERPERTSWQRFGSSWEHTIVLTGHDLDFGDSPSKLPEKRQPQGNTWGRTGMKGMMRPIFPGSVPRPSFQPPPPPQAGGLPPPFMQPPFPPPFGVNPQGPGPHKKGPRLGLGMQSEGSQSSQNSRGSYNSRDRRSYDRRESHRHGDDSRRGGHHRPRSRSPSNREFRRDGRDDRRDYRRQRPRDDHRNAKVPNRERDYSQHPSDRRRSRSPVRRRR